MYRFISTLFFVLLLYGVIFGTAQTTDYLIYKGDTLDIYSFPLESYFSQESRPDSVFEKYGYNSTGCWRGYIGYWELRNDSLFLKELIGRSGGIDLSLVFGEKIIDQDSGIFADWFNGSLFHPYGEMKYYIADGSPSIYEYEREYYFEEGKLDKIKEYDNRKTRKSIYSEDIGLLKEYIQSKINYELLETQTDSTIKVLVKNCEVTEAGKIDSVEILKGWNSEYDREALRVVKEIPEWEVIFRHGKQEQWKWMIPVVFRKKQE